MVAGNQAMRVRRWKWAAAISAIAAALILVYAIYCYVAEVIAAGERRREVTNMATAMEFFRDQFTVYPPDSSPGGGAPTKFFRMAFPRAGDNGEKMPKLDPAQSLVFWLSLMRKDPEKPYGYFDFDKSRIKDGRYYPPGSDEPYVYFSSEDSTATYNDFKPYRFKKQNRREERNNIAPDRTMQIICPGRDGKLGKGGAVGPKTLGQADADNVVSFSELLVGEMEAVEDR